MKHWIGTSGWQYPEWRGNFYSKKLSSAQWFAFYTQQFNTVEINYTHYHNVTEKNLQKWFKQAPDNFRYSLKVHRLLTHYKKMVGTKKLLHDFYKKTDILENKLGCILFQFPHNFVYSEENLENILAQIDSRKKNVIEFRHASWWRADVLKIFKKHQLIFCSLDGPELSRDLMVTGKVAYLRFHGRKDWYLGNYSKRNLQQWVTAVKEHKIQEVWAYFNNTAFGHAPKNALDLQRLFNEL